MRHTWLLLVVALLASAAAPASAQSQAPAQGREPLRGAVADLRLLTSSLPSGNGWTPVLPAGGLLPGRGFGVEGGGQVVIGPGRYRRLGVGATGLVAQGRATGTSPAPTVTTRFLTVAPHASMNFGHADGWSSVSIGAGLAKVTSSAAGTAAVPGEWGLVFHYGAGGRWFLAERVALSLDLRFWALTPRAATATRLRAPATTRIALGVGVSLR
jgi:hypothetical protein